MADQIIKDESDRGSSVYVAYLLLLGIARKEDKMIAGNLAADADWIIKTYHKCYRAAYGGRPDEILKG